MKKIISLILVAVLFIGAAFTLSSCGSERPEVESLIEEYFEDRGINIEGGYAYSYTTVYNIKTDKTEKEQAWRVKYPSKYYIVQFYDGSGSVTLYKGMFDKK